MTEITDVSTTPRTLLVLLAERDLYPAEAARLLRVSPTTLYAWCDGRFRPSDYHTTRLWMMLGCTPEELEAALEATKHQRDGGNDAGLDRGGGRCGSEDRAKDAGAALEHRQPDSG